MRAILGKLTLLLFSALLCVLFAELAVRMIAPQKLSIWAHTSDGLVVLRANVRGHRTRQGKLFETNSMGLRGPDHATEKQAGVYRILLMGDSFMEAAQVEWDDSLAKLLERRLANGSKRPVEVITAGVSGWTTDDYLTYFRLYGAKFSPDLILISMTLHNDVYENLAMKHHSFDLGGTIIEKPFDHRVPEVPRRRRTSSARRVSLDKTCHIVVGSYFDLEAAV